MVKTMRSHRMLLLLLLPLFTIVPIHSHDDDYTSQAITQETQHPSQQSPSTTLSQEQVNAENDFDVTNNIIIDDDHHHHHHDDNNDNAFCKGSFDTMFMDGFRWSLFFRPVQKTTHDHPDDHSTTESSSSSSSLPPCLAYYVSSWKLDASGKFRGACVFSFLLALLTEALSASRFVLIQFLHSHSARRSRHHKIVLTMVYALQHWMGTMIMLASMMYSIEMLLSVVAGLMVGNFLFVRDYPLSPNNNNKRMGPSMTTTTATTPATATMASTTSSGMVNFRRSGGNGGGGLMSEEERQGLLVVDDASSSCCYESTTGLQLQTAPTSVVHKED